MTDAVRQPEINCFLGLAWTSYNNQRVFGRVPPESRRKMSVSGELFAVSAHNAGEGGGSRFPERFSALGERLMFFDSDSLTF